MSQFSTNHKQRILVIDGNPAIHEDFRTIFRSGNGIGASSGTGSVSGPARNDPAAAEAALFGRTTSAPAAMSKGPSFVIDSAHQGQDGLSMVRAAIREGRPYAMAFIDLRMPPGWDGMETIERLWEVDSDLQVVICTALSDSTWDEMIGKIGASDQVVILKRPFDHIEVLQLANALTSKWRLLQQAKERIWDLEAMANTRAGELLKSEARYRLIAENASDLISVWTTEEGRLFSSPSHERVLGFTPDELRNTTLREQIHPDDQEKVRVALESAKLSGTGQMMECRMQHRDGSWRVLESRINPVANEQGEIAHVVIVARDITERTKAEEQRRQMEVQLRHAQKMESIGQLAAGIAHEINTPTQYIGDNTRFLQDAFRDLNGLLSAYAELLDAAKTGAVTPDAIAATEAALVTSDVDYLADEIPKAIEQSLEGLKRVSKIVSAMKEFSHPGTSEKVAIDLNRAIESTLTVATNEWKYVAAVVTEFDPALPPVICLPGEVNQVILNIVVNACHAIRDVIGDGSNGKGTITIRSRREGDFAEIRIRDTGTGMPPQVRARVFDPFFTTKDVGRGTGQGLAIAHSVIVDKHGGTIEVESEVGQGTTFILRLPIQPGPVERRAA